LSGTERELVVRLLTDLWHGAFQPRGAPLAAAGKVPAP
jgi:hypothetical protein